MPSSFRQDFCAASQKTTKIYDHGEKMEPRNKPKPEPRHNYEFGIQLLKGEFINLPGNQMTKAQALVQAEKFTQGFTYETPFGDLRLITKYNVLYVNIEKNIDKSATIQIAESNAVAQKATDGLL
jgi:hypothetical protein